MKFRLPLLPLLLLGASCYDGELRDADTASPNQADTDVDTDTGSDAPPATPEGLCDAVFTLCEDAWGWESLDSCYEGWLGQGQDWECADISGYLACAATCLDATDCEAFGACEPPCWDAHCL